MPDVLISENIVGDGVQALRAEFAVSSQPELWKDPALLRKQAAECRAMIVRNQTRVDADLIAACPRLTVIGRMGVGLDNIDMAAASQAGIVVTFAPDGGSNSVAELAVGLMIALGRGLAPANSDTRGGGWNRQRFMDGVELHGKTLGLVGLGRIGFRTGLKAKALGMEVVAFDPYADPDSMAVTELRARLVSLDELCAGSDFISCHLPETPETRGLFSYERFAQMKAAAYFVNTARGGIVDESGLSRALSEKRLAGAALDVRRREPPSERSPLETMDNVILTPHIGAFTREAQKRITTAVCRDVGLVLRGQPARQAANFTVPKKETRPS